MAVLKDLLYREIDGADDFVPVVDYSGGVMYDWSDFHAWYSPSRRAYFWLGDGGCSCSYWGEAVNSLDDFESGKQRSDLLAGFNRWWEDQHLPDESDRVAALYAINTFRPEEGTNDAA